MVVFRRLVSRPKLHHHVPQYYQQGFCKDGRLWVFDRVTGRYRHDQPKNVGAKTHDYSIVRDDGRKDPTLEEFLSQIEGECVPVFQKLRAGETLSNDDKDLFAYYLGFFFLRGPRFQRLLDELMTVFTKKLARFDFCSPNAVKQMFDEMPDFTDEQRARISPEVVYEFARREQYTVRVNRDYGLKLMVEEAIQMQRFFRQMDWFVGHAARTTAFLTTDNPLVIVPAPPDAGSGRVPGSNGVISPGALKIFPIAADTCLMMLDQGDRVVHKRMTPDSVRRTNIEVVSRCERLVLGRDEAHVRNLVRTTRVNTTATEPIFDAGLRSSR